MATALVIGSVCVVSGCTSTGGSTGRSAGEARPFMHTMTVGTSVQGRAIESVVIGDGPVRIMFIATIHGDEPAGTPLLERLIREAAATPAWMTDRTLIVVPVANPDGYESNRRGNDRGVDLNRNFPAESFTSRRRHGEQPLSEPEAAALHDAIIAHKPMRIISLHQPLKCLDYDGDGEAVARAMSNAIKQPHRLPVKKLGALPGSLGSFAGEDLGIPIITVEFDSSAHRLSDDELWSRFGEMLITAVTFPTMPVDD